MVAKSSIQDSSSKKSSQVSTKSNSTSAGIKFVKNEPYTENEYGLPHGQYTEKIYYLRSYVPRFVAALIPSSASYVVEYSWNGYPRCKTIYHVPYFGDKFYLCVDSVYCDDEEARENAMDLTGDELEMREVVQIDICSEEFVALQKDEDPTKFKSEKYARGPFSIGWFKSKPKPMMYAYKVVRFEFKRFGIQQKVEKWCQQFAFRNSFVRFSRRIVCWMDEWLSLSITDIRNLEKEAAAVTAENFSRSYSELAEVAA